MKVLNLHLKSIGPFIEMNLDSTPGASDGLHRKLNVFAGANGNGKSVILKSIDTCIRGLPQPEAINSFVPYFRDSNSTVHIVVDTPSASSPQGMILQKAEPGAAWKVRHQNLQAAIFNSIVSEFFPKNVDGALVYISSDRGGVSPTSNESEQPNPSTWRNIATAQRFASLRGLMELLKNADEDRVVQLQAVLDQFFDVPALGGKLVRIVRPRRNSNGKGLITNVESFGRPHELGCFASGSLDILFIVAETFLLKNSLILFDEPEVHLHPLVQDLLVKYLIYLTTPSGGDNQVIIATHSLSMIYGCRVGRVINLRLEDDVIRPEVIINDGEPQRDFEGALDSLGYSRSAIDAARGLFRDFKKSNPNVDLTKGGWGLGE